MASASGADCPVYSEVTRPGRPARAVRPTCRHRSLFHLLAIPSERHSPGGQQPRDTVTSLQGRSQGGGSGTAWSAGAGCWPGYTSGCRARPSANVENRQTESALVTESAPGAGSRRRRRQSPPAPRGPHAVCPGRARLRRWQQEQRPAPCATSDTTPGLWNELLAVHVFVSRTEEPEMSSRRGAQSRVILLFRCVANTPQR